MTDLITPILSVSIGKALVRKGILSKDDIIKEVSQFYIEEPDSLHQRELSIDIENLVRTVSLW